jgi:ADP-ribose pyrophosphatase YjhB (NUDIX family)
MKNPFKNSESISDKAYRKGREETEVKLRAEFDQLKEEILNSHAEEINQKDMEIMTLETQLKNWKADYLLSQQKIKEAKSMMAENKRERYRIDKFKEEMARKIQELQNDEMSKYQDLLEMIGVKQLEG